MIGMIEDEFVVWEEVIQIVDALRRRFGHIRLEVSAGRVRDEWTRKAKLPPVTQWTDAVQRIVQERYMRRRVMW